MNNLRRRRRHGQACSAAPPGSASRGETPTFQMAMLGTFGDTPSCRHQLREDRRRIPLKIAALIGCGVLTGVGAALNTADDPARAT